MKLGFTFLNQHGCLKSIMAGSYSKKDSGVHIQNVGAEQKYVQ